MAIYDISPTWRTEVQNKARGGIPNFDNSTISALGVNSGLVAWNQIKTLLEKSRNRGTAFSIGILSTYSLAYTGTQLGYFGGVLATNGDIHFVPFNARVGQKINISGVVSTYSLIYTVTSSLPNAYSGGVIALNGDIHFVPTQATVGQKIDINGVVSTYSLVYNTLPGYSGGVLAPNGDIYFVPRSSPVGQKISNYGVVSTYSHARAGYYGGVLAPNGDIHFISTGSFGQKISTLPAKPLNIGLCCSPYLNKY
jgi:hypothetical protein